MACSEHLSDCQKNQHVGYSAGTQLDSLDYGQVYYNPLGVARSRFAHGEMVEMLSDAAIALMLSRVVTGHVPVSTDQELFTNVCDVDDHVVRLAIQQEHIDWMNAINAIKSLKDALAHGFNEALARSIEVFLPSPARQKDDVKLLIDRCRLQACLDQAENSCMARYMYRYRNDRGRTSVEWRRLTIRGPDVLSRAS